MELDELKTAWQTLHAKVERQTQLNLRLLREGHADRVRRGLRPLAFWQGVQMGLGGLLALGSGMFWTNHHQTPHLLVTGLVMHAYGLALILFGARTQFLLNRLDFGLPVLEIQRRLAELRRFYIVGGLWMGLPWWILWMPLMAMLFMGLFGADLFVKLPPGWIYGNLAIGALGLLATFLFHRFAKRRPQLAEKVSNALTGRSLREAQRLLDEISRFEAE